MRIDHVTIGARDIESLRAMLWDGYGFGLIQGSAHSDGTQGWLVPFDTPQVQYLELLTPGDLPTLTGSDFGRHFLERTADGPAFLTWALLSEDITKDAERVRELTGADPELIRGESVRADGQRFPWAEAAYRAAWMRPVRPFFLEYGNWPARRTRVEADLRAAGHRTTPREFAAMTLDAVEPDLSAWWGHAPLPVTVTSGDPEGFRTVVVHTDEHDVEVVL